MVSAIQISCSARLAFGCWLFGSLFSTLAVLCTQQRWPRVLRPHFARSPSRSRARRRRPRARAPIASPRRFRSSSSSFQDCALSRTPSIRPTSSFLPSGVAPMMTSRHCASSSSRACTMDAVGPEVDVALGGEIALAPAHVLLRPGLLEPPDGRGRQPAGILAEQARPAPPRSRRWRRPSGRGSGSALRGSSTGARRAAESPTRSGCALTPSPTAVAHARAAHGDRADAGHDLALGQMPVAHQPLAAVLGLECRHDWPSKAATSASTACASKRSRAVAQNLGQRIGKSPWLGELENVSFGHGVSLLRWRSGGSNTPTIRRLTPSCRHQLSPIARPRRRMRMGTGVSSPTFSPARASGSGCSMCTRRRTIPLAALEAARVSAT